MASLEKFGWQRTFSVLQAVNDKYGYGANIADGRCPRSTAVAQVVPQEYGEPRSVVKRVGAAHHLISVAPATLRPQSGDH